MIAVGIGSFLGHAAATDWGRLLDSLAIKLAEASLQPHGLWHILAAAGIACIYLVHRSETL